MAIYPNPATSADKEPNAFRAASQFEDELEVIFGPAAMAPAKNNVGDYPTLSRMKLRIMRSYYTHDELMTGQCPLPQGYGFWGSISEAATAMGAILKAAAPFIAMIPGIGTGVAMMINVGGSLAGGDRIDAALITGVEGAIPTPAAKKSFRSATELGYAAARGENIGDLAIQAARSQADMVGGPMAVAAFDSGLAIGTGQGLQDAGFQLLGAWVKAGDNPIARAAQFALDVKAAAEQGVSIQQFLFNQAKKEFLRAVPVAAQADALYQAIQYFIEHPDQVLDPQMADIAARLGLPIEAIRAAMTCIRRMANGTITVDENAVQAVRPFIKTSTTAGPSAIQAMGANMTTITSIGRLLTADERANLASLQLKGSAMAASNATIAASRALDSNADWKKGFDIATALCQGSSQIGPGQERIRNQVSPLRGGSAKAVEGFNVGMALQHGISKNNPGVLAISRSPSIAAGQLVTQGIAGSNLTPDERTAAMRTVVSDSAARVGAAQAVEAHKGLWARFKEFFGL